MAAGGQHRDSFYEHSTLKPRFPTERPLIPFKTYMEGSDRDGKSREYHIPPGMFNNVEAYKNLIRASKQFAQYTYNQYMIDQNPDNYNSYLHYQQVLDYARGAFVKHVFETVDTSPSIRQWNPVSVTDTDDEILFEVLVSDLRQPHMDPVFPEPVRFVVRNQDGKFFDLYNDPKKLILSFLTYATQYTGELVGGEYKNPAVNILSDMTRKFQSDAYSPVLNGTGPSLEAKFSQFNDVGVSDIKRTIKFTGNIGFSRYEGTFSRSAPRFAASEGYMHTGALELANQVIKDAFLTIVFSYELRVDVTTPDKNFAITWTAYRYNKMKTDMYQMIYTAENVKKFEETSIQEIVTNPVPEYLVKIFHPYRIDSKHASRFREYDYLKLHVALLKDYKPQKTDMNRPTYMYNFSFWTFIASFIPVGGPGSNFCCIIITLINRLSDAVSETKERLLDERILVERERTQQLYQAHTIVTGQNKLLRDLIRDVNLRIGQLPFKTTDLPQGNPRIWLIFGTNLTREMSKDVTLVIEGLTPDKRQAMERKSNLIKAQILNRYFSDAIAEDQIEAQAAGRNPNVFDFLYKTREMQDFISLNGYDKFEKICPGVFALVIRAFPMGYKTGSAKNSIPAFQYWNECIHTMLGESDINPKRINTKNGESFAPEVQFYIDSVLAHQNKKRRQPRALINTEREVTYPLMIRQDQRPTPHSLFRVDGPGRRTNGLLQAQGDKEDREGKDSKECLQSEIDSLRRSVNQLALMQA